MISKLILFSIRNRLLIVIAFIFVAALGVYNFQRLPIDAVPDITNVQVQINTSAEGLSTLQVEKQSGVLSLTWAASAADSDHDPAEYYMVYRASAAASGFSILDSGTPTTLIAPNDPEPVVFYSIVAANVAGTSPDVPAP